MNNTAEFEILAKLQGLSVDQTDDNYDDLITDRAKIFWDAQQVKIDKLTHDLASSDCAARMFQYLLENHIKEDIFS